LIQKLYKKVNQRPGNSKYRILLSSELMTEQSEVWWSAKSTCWMVPREFTESI